MGLYENRTEEIPLAAHEAQIPQHNETVLTRDRPLSCFDVQYESADDSWRQAINAEKVGDNTLALQCHEDANRGYREALMVYREGRPDLQALLTPEEKMSGIDYYGDRPLDYNFFLKVAITKVRIASDPSMIESFKGRREALYNGAASAYDEALSLVPNDGQKDIISSLIYSLRAKMYASRSLSTKEHARGGSLGIAEAFAAKAHEDIALAIEAAEKIDDDETAKLITQEILVLKGEVRSQVGQRQSKIDDSSLFLRQILHHSDEIVIVV